MSSSDRRRVTKDVKLLWWHLKNGSVTTRYINTVNFRQRQFPFVPRCLKIMWQFSIPADGCRIIVAGNRQSFCISRPSTNIGEIMPRGSKVELTVESTPRLVKGRSGMLLRVVIQSLIVFYTKPNAVGLEVCSSFTTSESTAFSEAEKASSTSLLGEWILWNLIRYFIIAAWVSRRILIT